eukprot:TRINITY_DN4195_c0_g1_i1.p1 TRINITY_DN4195_c0_g1~~TRINITY_DN4195_c0_g1_i1.p1  ORF type:complete len:438 (-),score=45.41 TRINITY_DN4195_c0_g1_i1:7-1320(-)
MLNVLSLFLWLTLASAFNCPKNNTLQFTSTYWAESDALGHYWSQLKGALSAGHISPTTSFSVLDESEVAAIIDIQWFLFTSSCSLLPDVDSRLSTFNSTIYSYIRQGKIAAFYVYDEPYVAGCLISVIEAAISLLNKYFPNIPTYITFARHCFDPSYQDPACRTPTSQRGIPKNLDWIGFDWYMDPSTSCGTYIFEQFQCRIADGVQKIANLAPSKKAILIPDALSLFYHESVLIEIIHLYFYFAHETSAKNVYGMDFFLWADNSNGSPPFNGLVSMPTLRSTVRSFSREVSLNCGISQDLIPILQYTLANKDIFYSPWFWYGYVGSGYLPQGAVFALAVPDTPNSKPFYECVIVQPGYDNHWLTFSSKCDSLPIAPGTTAVQIGAAFSTQVSNTVPLWRFCSIASPFYHLYTTDSNPIPGMVREMIIAYVYPSTSI